MKGKLYLFTVVLFFSRPAIAQSTDPETYHKINRNYFNSPTTENSTGYSGTGANIDVFYHRANWTIDPNSPTKVITGTVTTYFKTTQANVSAINFDLNKASFNNGSLVVTYHGITCTKSFPSSGLINILNITLPVTIPSIGTRDSVVINYSGIPPVVSGAAEGYQVGTNGTDKYVMTLSESYEDRDWWPCKADMKDKIDSAMDMNFTVPWNVATADTFWVAANGILVDSSMITATTRNFSYKTTYPIASYLVALSVGKFKRYYRSVNINGTNTPVAYYLLRNTTNHAAKIANMDQMNLVIVAFSNKFGDYPFKLEKHGFYDGLLGAGGMEHQTFSAIASSQFNLQTLAHELMHQWFGDNVSFQTWNDLWLAEGFARYSEALCGELVPSLGLNPYTIRNGFKTSALGLNTASTWIPDAFIVNSDQIWNTSYGSTVYDRGCMVVSMLRAMCGDTKFFQACTNYQTALAGKSATTDDLKSYFNAVVGVDISEFFKDYVGGSGSGAAAIGGVGNPINTVNWNSPSSKKLVIQIGTQSKSAGSNVSYFNGPVIVRATGAGKDTTIVFYDWGGGLISYAGNGISWPPNNFVSYDLSFVPTGLVYDDSARTLSTGSTNKLITLDVNFTDLKAYKTTSGNQINLSITYNELVDKVILLKSANGADFMEAGIMTKTNTPGTINNFQFTDVQPFSPVTFYRAKIYTAGREQYSEIVKVGQPVKKELTVIPNPAKDLVNICFSNSENVMATISVVNAEGKIVIESSTKNDFINFDVSNLPAGIYLVQVKKPGEVTGTNKLMIRH